MSNCKWESVNGMICVYQDVARHLCFAYTFTVYAFLMYCQNHMVDNSSR